MTWDRHRGLSELLDVKARSFLARMAEGLDLGPWSLWGRGGQIAPEANQRGGEAVPARHRDIATAYLQAAQDGAKDPMAPGAEGLLCVPILYEFEVEGVLVVEPSIGPGACPDRGHMARMAAELVELLASASLRQALMTEVHSEAMANSYEELMERNRELSESERRYRELAENLEVRVTEKTAELEKAYLQLLRSEKMASIGRLAAGVAHEINNPLSFVKSNLSATFETTDIFFRRLQACHDYLAGQPEGAAQGALPASQWADLATEMEDFSSLVNETLDGVRRVQKIVNDLREFAHLDAPEIGRLDIHEAIEGAIRLLGHQMGEGIEIVRSYAPGLPALTCHPGEINQVLMNVLSNAVQALSGKGRVVLATARGAEAVTIRVSDSGPGIPAVDLQRIFDPFFTTRPVGAGQGTGLSVSYGIVKAHGGDIEVDSEMGRGTTVTIQLPILAET